MTDSEKIKIWERILLPGILLYIDEEYTETRLLASPIPEYCFVPSFPQNIPDTSLGLEEQDVIGSITSDVIKHGFVWGQHIWTRWRYFSGQYGDEGRCEIAPYWEYDGIDVELTKLICPDQ